MRFIVPFYLMFAAVPVMAQQASTSARLPPLDHAIQIDVNHAIAPFQEQRNAAADAAAFCSINLTQMQAQIAKLKAEIEELKSKKTGE